MKTHLDKLDPLSKWLVGVKLVTGNSLAKSGQAYEHCKSLFKYRNKIVHHKSKPFEFNAEKMSILIEEGERGFHSAVLSSNIAVKELSKEIDSLHQGLGKPFSFI